MLEKLKFPPQIDALPFPGRSGLRAALSGVNLLGGFSLSAKTYWGNFQGKKPCASSDITILPPSCTQSIFKKCTATSSLFPSLLKVTEIFPREGIWQTQMVTGSVPTKVSTKTGAPRNALCAKMGLQSSILLQHQRLPLLYYSKINILKRQVFSYSFSLNCGATHSISGIQVSSQSQGNL